MGSLSLTSIRSQLIFYFSLAAMIPALIITLVGMKLIYDEVITRAESKTVSDLNSAREIYQNKTAHIESLTRLTAARSLVVAALVRGDRPFLQRELSRVLVREGMDVLTIIGLDGVVVSRGSSPAAWGDTVRGDPFVEAVLRTGQPIAGTDVVGGAWLARETRELAARAAVEVVPAAARGGGAPRLETSGIMLRAAVPVLDESARLVGVLTGGVLLNRSVEIVDKINRIVHQEVLDAKEEAGTATIFLGDLRVSTNVKNRDGSRAVGTLVSPEVRERVLERGERWVGFAMVVDEWYIAAYEPIRGPDGKTLGMLYVGVPRRPFYNVLWRTLVLFGVIALCGVGLIVFIAILQAGKISRPLKALEGIAGEIAGGNFRQPGPLHACDEVEHLARSIGEMARKLEAEREELEQWGSTLEKKVRDRTEEIGRIHAQLFRSEKLASVGKLAAGVAHEINNPLTGILTNSSLMLEELEMDDPRRDDVDIIVKETIRCREIVKRLLDFARQTQPQKKRTDLNALVDGIILLVRNQASFRSIEIRKDLDPALPEVYCDPDQIRQVCINIILNAAEAMTGGGTLTVTSQPEAGGVVVEFADTGPGITEEARERIFDPFFTTKEHGTGLGLSISYGIVEQHGGSIRVDSCPGRGATFSVELPAAGGEGT